MRRTARDLGKRSAPETAKRAAPATAKRSARDTGKRSARDTGGRSAPEPGKRSAPRVALVVTILTVLGIGGVLASSLVGQLPASPSDVLGAALKGLGIDTSLVPAEVVTQTMLFIRFPRVVMSLLVGALLAVAGAVMQAIFGNPLAEPGVVGVSSGAAVGAAFAIATSVTIGGEWTVAVCAFLGGLLATLMVYFTARAGGRTEVVTLLLTGIAVNAFCGAALALLMFSTSTAGREQIVFWQLGTMNGSRWSEDIMVAVVGAVGIIVAVALGRRYDLLALGERNASHLGVRVERLRIISIVVVALLTGVGVAFVGIIAFVGLVVPHLVRMMLGPAHRVLIPVSALAGAVLLTWADLFARTVVANADLPIGLLTSLIGGPFFFWLIRRARRGAGGWA